jgi:hypothetical protein
MKRIAISSFLFFLLFLSVAIAEDRVYTINVKKNRIFTLQVPCEFVAMYDQNAMQLDGKGRVASVLVYEPTSFSIVCKDGSDGYSVVVTTDEDKPVVDFLKITDHIQEFKSETRMLKTPSDFEVKEDIVREARALMVSMVKGKILEGYEYINKNEKILSQDSELSATLKDIYSGQLIGLVYKIEKISNMQIVRNLKDFSTKGVVMLYSPSADKEGNIRFLNKPVLLYVVALRAGEDFNYSRIPWIEKGSSSPVGEIPQNLQDYVKPQVQSCPTGNCQQVAPQIATSDWKSALPPSFWNLMPGGEK